MYNQNILRRYLMVSYRIISNRASAQKSRLKKVQYVMEMEKKAKTLEVITVGRLVILLAIYSTLECVYLLYLIYFQKTN